MKTKHSIIAVGLACAALLTRTSSRADMVTDWNETAETVIRASTPSPPLQTRALAIVNAAVYDAVNGIARKYQPYFVTTAAPPGARAEAAAAQAAFATLTGLFPAQSGLLEEKLAESIGNIPGHEGKSQSIARGRAWGEQVAQAVLAWRATDGLATPVTPISAAWLPVNGARSLTARPRAPDSTRDGESGARGAFRRP